MTTITSEKSYGHGHLSPIPSAVSIVLVQTYKTMLINQLSRTTPCRQRGPT